MTLKFCLFLLIQPHFSHRDRVLGRTKCSSYLSSEAISRICSRLVWENAEEKFGSFVTVEEAKFLFDAVPQILVGNQKRRKIQLHLTNDMFRSDKVKKTQTEVYVEDSTLLVPLFGNTFNFFPRIVNPQSFEGTFLETQRVTYAKELVISYNHLNGYLQVRVLPSLVFHNIIKKI